MNVNDKPRSLLDEPEEAIEHRVEEKPVATTNPGSEVHTGIRNLLTDHPIPLEGQTIKIDLNKVADNDEPSKRTKKRRAATKKKSTKKKPSVKATSRKKATKKKASKKKASKKKASKKKASRKR